MNKTYTRLLLLFLLVIISPSFLFAQLPVNTWAKNFGGSGDSKCTGMQVDKQNNVVMCGYFRGTVDFDPTAGVHNVSSKGDADIYVAKLDPNGNLLWVATMGGNGLDQVNDLSLDSFGNVAISGQFTSTDLDADPDAPTVLLQSQGAEDAFLIYLDSNGHYKWAKSFGSFGTDRGANVVFDTNNNLIFTGYYDGSIDVGGTALNSSGGSNGFAVKYQNNGNLTWAINLGSSGNDAFRGLAVDSKNNIILSGYYNGTADFDPLGSGHNLTNAGDESFISEYGADGKLKWVNRISGTLYQNGSVICIDSKDNVYMAGSFNSGINFDPNNPGGTIYPAGDLSMFISKYTGAGNFQYAKVIGGQTSGAFCYQIAPDANNNIYITGYFSGSVDFNPDANVVANVNASGSRNLFLGKYDENGNFKWAFNAGDANCDGNFGIELDVDSQSNLLLGGAFCNTIDFDPSKCIDKNLTAINSICDSFIAKYSQTNTAGATSIINSFSVTQQSSPPQINTANSHITVNVPAGTNITALAPIIGITNSGILSPASGTTHDFTKPVDYVVTTNCSFVTYTVDVIVAATPPPVLPNSGPMVCATSGADGTTNINGSINTYFPPINNVTLAAGSKTITLATVPSVDAHGNNFGTVPIKSGDLLLIIQTQDATINYTNTTAYGSNNPLAGPDNLGATGFTNLGSSGKFEYVMATNNVPLTGGTLTFTGSGTGGGTVYTYTNADASNTRGKQSFQVIRIPQYANLRLTSNVSPPPFNGKAGGVIAFEVSGNMDFNGFTINVSERGFRGGYSLVKVAVGNIPDLYVTNATDNRASGKGEGIAGTPRYMWDGFNQVDNIIEGLPGGSAGKGAPANAGGGGNDTNSGGGGGGNGDSGGVGGWGYEPIGGTNPSGGRPGSKSYVNDLPDDATRLIMGGGGGGGHANDALTGVKGGVGGGVVIVSARTISGNGTILANGAAGAPGVYGSHPDGSGGGGAGGSVFLKVSNASATANITVHATGGKGGNTEGDNPATTGVQPHGPGGGGSGGIIFYNIPSGTFHSDVTGGLPGRTDSGNGITHNSGGGLNGKVIPLNVAALPPYLQSGTTICFPVLTTTMSIIDQTTPKTVGGTATYTIKIVNDPSAGSAAGVQADCLLPSGFTFQSATAAYLGSATGAATLTNTGTDARPLLGDFIIPAGGTVTVTLLVKIGCVASGTYNASAQAPYFDPTRDYTAPNRRITAKTNAFAGSNTTYQTTSYGTVGGSNFNGAAATAEDAKVVNTAISNNSITATPPNTFCLTGNPGVISGSTPVSSGTFTYQWQTSTDNITFTDIAGAIAKDYDPTNLNATTYYRRAVISASCATPVLSNVVTITVQSGLSNNKITAPATSVFCAAGNPLAIVGNVPSGGDGTYTYTWQSSADNINFVTIAGAIAKDYDPGTVNVTTYYRRTAVSTLCTVPLLSNVVTITVQPVISNNAITAPIAVNFCTTGNAAAITGSAPSGDTGTYNYQWQSSTNNATFSNIAGATNKDYDPPIVNITTYFRRTVASGACTLPVVSNTVTIKVEPALANNSITGPATNTFCVAADPAAITGSTPTGGNGAYSYQWQNSADNINFNNIAGAVVKDYDPPVVNATTYFRRAVVSDVCTAPLISNIISIKIVAPVAITNNVITAPVVTAFCTSGNPGAVTGNTPSGGIGTFTYQWQSSANSITFTDIAGATAIDFDPPTITADTYYRRVATSGTCLAPVNSNVISIKILPAVNNNIVTAPLATDFCASGDAGVIAGSTPTGGTGTYVYQWQSSANNTTFTDIAGATAKDYDPPVVNVTTYYRRTVISGSCATRVLSNVVTITIQPALSNNNITAPTVKDFCVTGNPQAIVGNVPSGGNGAYTYRWQSSTDNTTFTDITGATAKDYNPGVLNVTTYYRRLVVSNLCTVPLVSNVVTISIEPLLANNVITAPIANNFCGVGDAAAINGSVATGGNGVYSYQWQNSINNSTFTNITGATAKDYDPAAITVTTYFRRTVTSGACTVPIVSNAVVIKVEPPLVNNAITTPAINTFCLNGDPAVMTGSIPTGGNNLYSYQWQKSTDNIIFTSITGATAKDYDSPAINITTYFRRTVTSDVCTVPLVSNVVTITIQAPAGITNNVITAPAIASFCTGGNPTIITGNTPTGGTGTFTYQWQGSTDNINFADINGATAINFDPPALTADRYYRRVASSGNCIAPALSNVISIKILPAVANNTLTAPLVATYCAAGNPALITGNTPTGGSGTYAYQWQSSTNNTSFTDIAGATAKDYDSPAINTTTYYRRLVTSGPCTIPQVSNVVTIAVQAALTNNNIVAPAVSSFCINGNPGLITGNTPSGGNGTYSYQWQTSTDNITFGNITAATAKDYDPPVINAGAYYRRLVTSGTCTVPVASNVINITILSTPATPVPADAAPSVCPGNATTLIIKSPQTGITYNWYNSPLKTGLLFSGTSYPTGNLTTAKTYYIEATNGTCSSNLATITVSIAPLPTAPVLAVNPVAVCTGSAATLNILAPQNGFIYNWYSTATGGTSLRTGTSFVTPVITTAATYYAEATNAGGCISATRTLVNITVNPLPQLTVLGTAICPGSSATLTAVAPGFTGQVGWYADATTAAALQLSTSKSFNTPVLNSAKSYYVEAISTDNCKTLARVKVDVAMLQQLDAPVVSVDSTTNSSVSFKWDAVPGATGYQVSVDGGKTFVAPSAGSNDLGHKVIGLQLNQQVTILVQALGVSTCQLSGSSTAVTGTAISQLGNQIYVANAFTPNGDGNNDIVYVHSESIKSLTFYVYDQWGELLFTSTNITKGWDGYYKGTREPAGVYVYFVKAIMNDGAQLNKKGTITLLR